MKQKILVSFIPLLIAFLLGMAGTAEAKSIYLIPNYESDDFDAYNIHPDGTATYQSTHDLIFDNPNAIAIDANSNTLFLTSESENGIEIVDANTMTSIGTVQQDFSGNWLPTNLGGIDVDKTNHIVYAIYSYSNTLYAFDWDDATGNLTPKTGFPIYLPNCNFGIGIDFDDTVGVLYVADIYFGDPRVRAYEATTWTETMSFPVSHKPVDITVDPVRGFVYTVSVDGYCRGHLGGAHLLSKYDLGTGIETTFDMTHGGAGVAVDEVSGYVYVTHGCNGDYLSVWDTSIGPFTQIQATSDLGDPAGICISYEENSYNPLNLNKDDGIDDEACANSEDTIQYEICYDNQANEEDVTHVTIIDTLPEDVAYISDSAGGTYDSEIHMVTWDIGTLTAGASQACLTVDVMVVAPVPPGTSIALTNSATIGSDQTPPTTVDISTCVETPEQPVCIDNDEDGYGSPPSATCPYSDGDCDDEDPNIHPGAEEICGDEIDQDCNGIDEACDPCNPPNITKTDEIISGCVDSDDSITYHICYDHSQNHCELTNVTITDSLPPEVDYVSATEGGDYDNDTHTVTWDIGTLTAGASQACLTVDVMVVTPVPPGTSITLTNFATIVSDQTPPTTVDINTCVETPEQPVCIDNDEDGYGSPPSAACPYSDEDCDDEDPNIHPGAEEICDDEIDQDCDGVDEVCDPCDPPSLSKDDGLCRCVEPGGYMTYQICYDHSQNHCDLTNVTITDNLPSEVSFISATDDGEYDNHTHTVTWDIGTLPAGEPETCVQLVVQVGSSDPSETSSIQCHTNIINTCTIFSDQTEPVTVDEQSCIKGYIYYEPINLSIDDGFEEGECVGPNDTITYDICYDNTDNYYNLTNVKIIDTLSQEVSFVTATDDGAYDNNSHTVIWDIGMLSHGSPEVCVQLVVQVDLSDSSETSSIQCEIPEPSITNICTVVSDQTPAKTIEKITCIGDTAEESNDDVDAVTQDNETTETECNSHSKGDTQSEHEKPGSSKGGSSDKDPPTAPAPEPEVDCYWDADCNNGIFCDGEETCIEGECISGEVPCNEDEICMEDTDQCWDYETVTALSMQKTLLRPIMRDLKCTWLVLITEGEDNFDESNHVIKIGGTGDDAQGVTVDSERDAFEIWGYILVPICIKKEATAGEWIIELEIEVEEPNSLLKKIIQSAFEIK